MASAGCRLLGHAGGTGGRDTPLNSSKCREVNRQLRTFQRHPRWYGPWSGLQSGSFLLVFGERFVLGAGQEGLGLDDLLASYFDLKK